MSGLGAGRTLFVLGWERGMLLRSDLATEMHRVETDLLWADGYLGRDNF